MPSLKKNVLYQSAYQVLILLAPLVTAPYISRVLGPEGIGTHSWTHSIANYFVLLAMLGIANHGGRTMARVRDDRHRLDREFSDLLLIHVLVSVLALAAYLMFVLVFVRDNQAIFAVQGLWIVAAMLDLTWFFTGIEQFGVIVARNTIVQLGTVAAIFIFVRNSGDTWVYVALLAIGALLGQASVWPFLRSHVTLRRPSLDGAFRHLRPLLVLFAPVIATSLYRLTGRVLLGAMSSEAEVGLFSNAEKIIGAPLGLVTAFTTVMLPRISNLLVSGREQDVERLMRTSFRYVLLISLAITFGLAGIAPEFAPLFFGQDFAQTGQLIVGLAATIPFVAIISVIRSLCLIPRSLDKRYILSLYCGAVVSVIANLILIPTHGALGAVASVVIAEATVCVVQAVSVRAILPVWQYIGAGWFFLLSGAVMFVAVRGVTGLMQPGSGLVAVQIVTGLAIFAISSSTYLWRVRDGLFLSVIQRARTTFRRDRAPGGS